MAGHRTNPQVAWVSVALLGLVGTVAFVSSASSAGTVSAFAAPANVAVGGMTLATSRSTSLSLGPVPSGSVPRYANVYAAQQGATEEPQYVMTMRDADSEPYSLIQTALGLGAFLLAAVSAMYIAATRKSSSTQLPLLPLVNNQVALAATSGEKQQAVGRREAMATAAAAWGVATQPSLAASLPVDEEPPKILCDDKCLADLEKIPRQKTASGLEYRDIVVGTGPTPPLGYQVTFDLVATNPANGKTFVNTLEKGKPIDNRVGTDSMVKGLDEALTTMKAGGVRRVYCPGELAYQTPLKAAPGSPAVPAKAPIIFDVALLLVPGLEEEDQSGANEFADLFS